MLLFCNFDAHDALRRNLKHYVDQTCSFAWLKLRLRSFGAHDAPLKFAQACSCNCTKAVGDLALCNFVLTSAPYLFICASSVLFDDTVSLFSNDPYIPK